MSIYEYNFYFVQDSIGHGLFGLVANFLDNTFFGTLLAGFLISCFGLFLYKKQKVLDSKESSSIDFLKNLLSIRSILSNTENISLWISGEAEKDLYYINLKDFHGKKGKEVDIALGEMLKSNIDNLDNLYDKVLDSKNLFFLYSKSISIEGHFKDLEKCLASIKSLSSFYFSGNFKNSDVFNDILKFIQKTNEVIEKIVREMKN